MPRSRSRIRRSRRMAPGSPARAGDCRGCLRPERSFSCRQLLSLAFEVGFDLDESRFEFPKQWRDGSAFSVQCKLFDLRGEVLHAARANVAGAGLEGMHGLGEGVQVGRLLGGERGCEAFRGVVEKEIDHIANQFLTAQPLESVQSLSVQSI